MGTPEDSDPGPRQEQLLPAYESLARIIRKVVREEIAPLAQALEHRTEHRSRPKADES